MNTKNTISVITILLKPIYKAEEARTKDEINALFSSLNPIRLKKYTATTPMIPNNEKTNRTEKFEGPNRTNSKRIIQYIKIGFSN